MLKLQFRDNPERVIKLTVGTLTLGRDPGNDLVVDQASVSDFHAEIVSGADAPYIVDLLSAAGTFVNGQPVAGRHTLNACDVIRLGAVDLLVVDPKAQRGEGWALRTASGELASQLHPLQAHTVVGREAGCQLTIDDNLLSRRHAELFIEGDHLRVVDLGSSNGTFVNDQRISTGVARPGDELRFDQQRFLVVGPAVARAPEDAADRTQLRDDLEDPAREDSRGQEPREHRHRTDSGAVTEPEQARFHLLAGADQSGPRDVPLLLDRHYRMGRAAGCDIHLEDRSVSKCHAELRHTDGQWQVLDTGSSNGILVNGRRVVEHHPLEDGDRLQLGRLCFVFRSRD
ncbi:FHA domain-containing protein [Parahaliea mediterranea]|uniref:FHA domain-containing protein n=1 Tax=Parahaliea mediterranea TaxID=651086 RepID=A0A939DB25_9GAMM|nr:FHA domain-containing protein [Parahaliea mediterranea]MBN7794993.1 FHA domain-containing protein [Parahaliea mediterranea]